MAALVLAGWYFYGLLLNSIRDSRGFDMSCQVVVQSLSQWQEKYPGKEWENQLATFDQTLYMGCNDWTSADYISKKCGKVTISLTSSSKPQPPLYGFVYGNTRPYSQTRSSTQRELMQPDEILRLDRRRSTTPRMNPTHPRVWSISSTTKVRAWAWWSWGLTAWWAGMMRMKMKNSRRGGDPGGSCTQALARC